MAASETSPELRSWSRFISATSSSRTGPKARVSFRTDFLSDLPVRPRATSGSASRMRRGATRAWGGGRTTHLRAPGSVRLSAATRWRMINSEGFVRFMTDSRNSTYYKSDSHHAHCRHRHRDQLRPHDRRSSTHGSLVRGHRSRESDGATRGRRSRRQSLDHRGYERGAAGALEDQRAG